MCKPLFNKSVFLAPHTQPAYERKARAGSLLPHRYVSQDILGHEFAKQGGHTSLVSPLSPSPPVAGALRGELRARPAAVTAAFDADRFADHLQRT